MNTGVFEAIGKEATDDQRLRHGGIILAIGFAEHLSDIGICSQFLLPHSIFRIKAPQLLEECMKFTLAFFLAVFALPCVAQSPGKAEVFPASDVQAQLAQLGQLSKAKGSSGVTLGDFGTHAIKLSERTTSGGAEVHAHFDDVMIVMEGKATLITGGELIGSHTGVDGESTGSGIRNGITQTIATGDVVHVPAGVPHQLILAPGTNYSALVIKVKE